MPGPFTHVKLYFSATTAINVDSPQARVAKWTEGFWADGDNTSNISNIVQGAGPGAPPSLIDARRGILPTADSITKFGMQVFDMDAASNLIPRTGEQVVRKGGIGTWQGQDIPQMAVLVHAGHAGNDNTTRFTLRGIPDNVVVGGELTNEGGFRGKLGAYLGVLAANFGGIITDRKPPGITTRVILTVAADGLVTLKGATAAPFAPGNFVKVIRTTNEVFKQVGGIYKVADVDGPQFTLEAGVWEHGLTKGGTVRKHQRIWAQFAEENMEIGRATTRKVGSPISYRGINKAKRL